MKRAGERCVDRRGFKSERLRANSRFSVALSLSKTKPCYMRRRVITARQGGSISILVSTLLTDDD